MGKLPRMLALLLASCFVPRDPIADPDPPFGMHLRCTIVQVFPGEDAQEDDGPPAAPPIEPDLSMTITRFIAASQREGPGGLGGGE